MKKPLFEAEWIILETLWEKAPQTLGQIIQSIHAAHGEIKWNYKTYHTHLRRMEERELISNETRNQKDKLYYPIVTREDALGAESAELLRRSAYFGSIGRLIKALDSGGYLTETDQKELLDLAQSLEKRNEE
jgi:BlaI family transcriptional regulator, penicillinase repressor